MQPSFRGGFEWRRHSEGASAPEESVTREWIRIIQFNDVCFPRGNLMPRTFHVYILANRTRRLYIGVTNNLVRRLFEHHHGLNKGFTCRYNINRLVYWESTDDSRTAIAREKQLKGWRREKKVNLIESINPGWEDLSAGWKLE
jgi:putative endonuclease